VGKSSEPLDKETSHPKPQVNNRTVIKDIQPHSTFVTPLLRFLLDLMLNRSLRLACHCGDTLERSFRIALHGIPVELVWYLLGQVRR
jgi:hypothetical protein